MDRFFVRFFWALAVLFFVYAVIGGVVSYTPVPIWDMWPGLIRKIVAPPSDHWLSWWTSSLEMEHHIVLTRFLFWLDARLFHNSCIFLLVMNYVFAALIFYLFYRLLEESSGGESPVVKKCLHALIFCLIFSWTQAHNFAVVYQSQFFLAYLLPLAAFYLMYRSSVEGSTLKWFISCVLGVLAWGSMGNGVLAFPFMVIFALLLHMRWDRIAVLVVLSLVGFELCSYGLNSVSFCWHNLFTTSKKCFFFFLMNIGGLFQLLPGSSVVPSAHRSFSLVGGCVLLSATLFFLVRAWRERKIEPLQGTLFAFLFYCELSSVGIAMGRVPFGLDASNGGRYMTSAIMIVVPLLILSAPSILKWSSTKYRRVFMISAMASFIGVLLPDQLRSFYPFGADPVYGSRKNLFFERQVAALALNLGIKDHRQTHPILYHDINWLWPTIERARERGVSIFGFPLFVDARSVFQQIVVFNDGPVCLGAINWCRVIGGDERFVQISGWMFDPSQKTTPQAIRILDRNGYVVGYALTGHRSSCLKRAMGKEARKSGFKGYLLTSSLDTQVTLQGIHPDCQALARVPSFSL